MKGRLETKPAASHRPSPPGSIRRSLTTAIASILLALAPSTAQDPEDLRRAHRSSFLSRQAVEAWDARLREIDRLLLEGQYAKAGKKARGLGQEMMDRVVEWDATGKGLGLVTILRALAAAGEGDRHQAYWYWDVAKHFFPEVATYDLSAYGEAGQLLATTPGKPQGVMFPQNLDPACSLTPPEVLKHAPPAYPAGKRHAEPSGRVVIVSVVVGEDGLPWNPAILNNGGDKMYAFSVIEGLGKWRFEPALLCDRPVATIYTLTANFPAPR